MTITSRRCLFALLVGVLPFAAQSSFAQASLGLTAAQGAATWRQAAGTRLTFVCPASDGSTGNVYGTDVYTDDSAICAAAIHAGVLKPAQPGVISIVYGAGAEAFRGSERNGVKTRGYGAWPHSYTFARDGAPGRITWRTVWNQVPADFTDPITVECPADGKPSGGIWGTDVYTTDSAICVAAVHVGAITAAKGGLVVVRRERFTSQFTASERYGVASQRWGSSQDAFSVRAAKSTAATSPSTSSPSAVAPGSLEACPLEAAIKRTFAAMKTGITSEYAALQPTADATDGFDAATLTSQRDGLLSDLGELEQENLREATAACAAGLTTQTAPTPVAPPGSDAGATGGSAGRETIARGVVVAEPGGSPTLSAMSPTGPPPADFTITATPSIAHLRWTVRNSVAYKLFRADGAAATWIELPSLARETTDTRFGGGTFHLYASELDDIVPDPRITYRYRLVAEYGEEQTWGEAIVSFTSPPLVNPSGFRARFTASDVVTLEWDAVPGAIGYRIDGASLPSDGKTVTETSTTISPIRGEASWLISTVYPGGIADYMNRPLASTVSRPLPTHAPAWLSKSNGPGSTTETAAHYARLCNPNAPDRTSFGYRCENLAEVLGSWGVPSDGPQGGRGATYRNVTELGGQRATRCSFSAPNSNGGALVCHSDSEQGVSLIIMKPEGARFGFYEWRPDPDPTYYSAWGRNHRPVATVTFDSDGPKLVPHSCLSCHGGRYDPVTGLVTGASLLPIDPGLVELDGERAAQEEKVRQINAMIRQTYSSPAVAVYIEGLYGGVVNGQRLVDVPGAQAIQSYVPQGWAAQRSLYLDFVKKDCAMCHLAGPSNLNFLSAGNLLANKDAVHAAVCTARSMPHAETPFMRFWTSGSAAVNGPGWFAAALGFASCP